MYLYNTLTKQLEEFQPRDPNMVKMYTCGPTVYHYAHIGNLRTYIFEDVLEKSLHYLGYPVKRVMNITDVGHLSSDSDTGEDKMVAGAKRENITVMELADHYTKAFFRDMEELNIKTPGIIEKATECVPDYIKMIEKLLEEGYAYQAGGNVYFDVTKAKDYYQLSGRTEENNIVGAREDVCADSNKRNPYDFGLWFTSSKFENQDLKWDSPFGVGYPGWHIECSAMSMKHLGEYLDIHCGGVDNIFPHHTNEIAQSEAYLGHKWCSYWVHGEHLNDKDGKMSKSKGEFLTVALLKSKGYQPLSYRFMCLQSHYRKQLVFTYDGLSSAEAAYLKLKSRVQSLNETGELQEDKVNDYQILFKKHLSDDLNTANVLTTVFDLLKDETTNNHTKLFLIKGIDEVLSLGLLEQNSVELTEEQISEINELINKRNEAKANKDYALADNIREELSKKGIMIKDSREGTTFEIRR